MTTGTVPPLSPEEQTIRDWLDGMLSESGAPLPPSQRRSQPIPRLQVTAVVAELVTLLDEERAETTRLRFDAARTPDSHGHTGNGTFCQVCVNAGAADAARTPRETPDPSGGASSPPWTPLHIPGRAKTTNTVTRETPDPHIHFYGDTSDVPAKVCDWPECDDHEGRYYPEAKP